MPSPRINCKNFAINSRIYDTTASKTLYDPSIVNTTVNPHNISTMNLINYDSVNPDTAMGQSWFH